LIGGGGVALSTDNGVLANLRAAKGEGQSGFINPGLILGGVGADFDLLPELRLDQFQLPAVCQHGALEFLRHQANIPNSLGYDPRR
jgi:hypothetical protein